MPRPVYSFLALDEHPYACEMLRQLLDAGFPPRELVLERSELAHVEREKFLERIAGHPPATSLTEQAAAHGIPVHSMPLHASEPLLELIGHAPLDLVVLGGTRVLRGALLEYPRHGVLNAHPGLLPDCRGSASPAWSVHHDLPIGCTTHLCDAGIDTGDLLLRRELPVRRGMTYEDLCYETLVLSGQLMRETLAAYDEGRWEELRRPQGESAHPTFKNAPPEVLAAVRLKLAEERYLRYVD